MLMVSAVAAQPPATNGWQHIIFSSPDDAQISSNLTSATSEPSYSAFESKLHLFQDSSPVAALANLPPPAVPAPMTSRTRRNEGSSEGNQPWEFMTPAEILGVAPGQILQKKGGQGDQGSLTPLEHYLQSQNAFAQYRTNSAGNSFRDRNLWANGNGQTTNVSPALFGGAWGDGQSNASNPFLGNSPANNWSGGLNGDSIWPKMFGTKSPQPAFSPGQPQSDMSQLMQLLNPNSTPATAETAQEETPSFKPQTGWQDSDSTAPLANPIGASVAPLTSGISKPAGLAPLPSLSQPDPIQPAAPPAWAPQPPPWLSSTPQPFAVPQRKF